MADGDSSADRANELFIDDPSTTGGINTGQGEGDLLCLKATLTGTNDTADRIGWLLDQNADGAIGTDPNGWDGDLVEDRSALS
ncbi:hypothetical protein, partial [Bradyrhizobium sp.]